MKLFLASSSITGPLVEDFERFVGRPTKGLKVAFIPDAAYGEEGATWLEKEIEYQRNDLSFELDVFELADHDETSIKHLLKYDAIFIAGGLIVDLHRLMEKSGFFDFLPEFLNSGGIYIGSSASSMIMSKKQDTAVWFIGEEEPDAKEIEGFGVIDFQIYPHYESEKRAEMEKNFDPTLEYLLLKDGQALAIDEEGVEIYGGEIEVIKPTAKSN